MGEFQFVRWGEGVPVDYQRLNAMMLNEQHLKDLVEPLPRGIIMHKTIEIFSIDPNGGPQNITGLVNLNFTTEPGRLTSFEFHPGIIAPDVANGFEIRYKITVTEAGGSIVASPENGAAVVNDFSNPGVPLVWMYPEALPAGTHNVSVNLVANVSFNSITVGRDLSRVLLIVRDEGAYVSPHT